ncbi:MAG: chemotaxis protein CheW [Pyrinomonadaceae bacterium]|nr:chemotaxis protein CheW [Pyrinomonadaceae bacterium]
MTLLDLPPMPQTGHAESGSALLDVSERNEADRYVAFMLGDQPYCIAASTIAEVTPPLPFTFLPNAPANISGLAPLRGEAVAVVDLREMLGSGDQGPNARPKSVVLNATDLPTRASFEVDQMLGTIDGKSIEITPTELPGVIDAECRSADGTVYRRIDPLSIYYLLDA